MEAGLYKIFLLFLSILLCCSCKNTQNREVQHAHTNALINETSPYLLQHAHNPVNWRPWSSEALETAREEGKLVLVSIGYSSCHWCHVMEEETFEDEEVAALMNEHFISIKVDREERPDVDEVYMTALQLLIGSGGWPLNVITLPNGKPLYGGTYHTKDEWMKALKEISALYEESPQKAEEYADRVAQGIRAVNLINTPKDPLAINKEVLQSSLGFWSSKWDLDWGGNQGTQKFMLPANYEFLLDHALLSGDKNVLAFVKTTLNKMAQGGVYDQLGGGFFRYSTDPYWRIPHFEKMLYDNAQLISLYSKAYLVFKDPLYREVVQGIAAFLDREMKHPGGAYYAAMDADSEGGEGRYYLWTPNELQRVLGSDYPLFASYFDIEPGKEWEAGTFVLNRTVQDATFTESHAISHDTLASKKEHWKELLLKTRLERVPPRIDDKIITSWNALLINGFVDAFEAFGDSDFLDRAQAIYHFLESNNRQDGKLMHSYKKNSKYIAAFLEDYASLANCEINLFAATGNSSYLEAANDHLNTVDRLFLDKSSGLYRFNEDNELISKLIKTDDGVIPSPNALMAHNLFAIGHINYQPERIAHAREMLATVMPYLQQHPDTYTKWAALLEHMVYPYYEVAIVGTEAAALWKELKQNHLPNTLILYSNEPSELPLFLNRFVPGDTFIYVCQNHSCKLPVTTVPEAMKQITYDQ